MNQKLAETIVKLRDNTLSNLILTAPEAIDPSIAEVIDALATNRSVTKLTLDHNMNGNVVSHIAQTLIDHGNKSIVFAGHNRELAELCSVNMAAARVWLREIRTLLPKLKKENLEEIQERIHAIVNVAKPTSTPENIADMLLEIENRATEVGMKFEIPAYMKEVVDAQRKGMGKWVVREIEDPPSEGRSQP